MDRVLVTNTLLTLEQSDLIGVTDLPLTVPDGTPTLCLSFPPLFCVGQLVFLSPVTLYP